MGSQLAALAAGACTTTQATTDQAPARAITASILYSKYVALTHREMVIHQHLHITYITNITSHQPRDIIEKVHRAINMPFKPLL